MRATATATTPNSRPTGRSFACVYKDAVYDLFPRHVDRINELRTRSGTFIFLVVATLTYLALVEVVKRSVIGYRLRAADRPRT